MTSGWPLMIRRLSLAASTPTHAADRDMICVTFPYKELIKPPLPALKHLPAPDFMAQPALLVLIRKDLSKIYVNELYYQVW